MILIPLTISPTLAPPPQHRIAVGNAAELRRAVAEAKPGTRIELRPGVYAGGLYLQNLHGTAPRPIVIAAASAQDRPLIRGGSVGLHLSRVSHVELRDLLIEGATDNGLNIDDGGTYGRASHHVTLRGLVVRNIGPRGNHDGIKLSGVDDFRVEDCRIERWGVQGGSGIDMVGCHRGVIVRNTLAHDEGEQTGASGIQAKGGSRDIAIRRNRFVHAGARAINIGGSTGLEFFRPPLASWPKGTPRYEAKDVRVEGNTFVGSDAPVAFVGVDGATVRFNTLYRPHRWAIRILQETRAPGFVPSRNGVFADNIVVFRSPKWFEGGVNIGPGTAPQTFRFARNLWFCEDAPSRSRPRLPTSEENGIYGADPRFRNAAGGDLRLQPDSPARRMGAEAYREPL